ncbi:MAG: hypothetical protein KatS3mg125_0672 [Lysobacterales bacterium]|jgi:hypothetical protein|nr:MAG: hypothetical protein KatS3mg125_0672 [Xanthomonadales bacterium]
MLSARRLLSSAFLLLLAGCASRAPAPASASTASSTALEPFPDWQPSEETPILSATELVPEAWLKGPYHRIRDRVPVNGGFGVFVLESDFGELVVESVELLEIRIGELPAIAALATVSSFETFVDATAESGRRAAEALAKVLGDPVGTVSGLPSGIARLVRRTLRVVRQVALDLGDAIRERRERTASENEEESDAEQTLSAASQQGQRLLLRYIGYNRARRELAARLGVDPYTTNPLLNAQLDELAWAELGGQVGFRAALGATGALAEAVSVSQRLDRLVWELPPADIRHRNESLLLGAGFPGPAVRRFLRNGAFSPGLQIAFTDRLEALAPVAGSENLLELAGRAQDELEARTLIRLAGMALIARERFGPLDGLRISEEGSWVRHVDGSLSLLLPFDYLSHKAELEALLVLPEAATGAVRALLAGRASPGARRLLARMGYRLYAEFPPHPPLQAADDNGGREE